MQSGVVIQQPAMGQTIIQTNHTIRSRENDEIEKDLRLELQRLWEVRAEAILQHLETQQASHFFPLVNPTLTALLLVGASVTADPKSPRGTPRDWSTGMCSCFDDFGICLLEACCPIIHACMISSDMGEGFCMPCCVPFPTLVMRSHFRGKHNIQGSLMNDCCIETWCGPCAACQLAREVKMVNNGQAQP